MNNLCIYYAYSTNAMKTNQRPLISLAIAALLAPPVLAIEPPADNTPPPPVAEVPPPPADPAVAPAPAAQAAPYLGVSSWDVPQVLAAHIGLKAGEGIVISVVDPDGPGAKAGLAENDVITRVAGQPVGSHADLVKQIQSHKPGDEINLDLIHQGKPTTKSVTLAARPDGGEVAAAPLELDKLMLGGMPQEQAKRIREAIERQRRAMQNGAVIPQIIPGNDPLKMGDAMKEMQKHMEDAMKLGIRPLGGGAKIQGSATFRMVDEQGSIELKSADGGKEATLRDKDNKVTWTGPWDTEQDKAAAPPAVRSRLEKLNIDNNFNGNGLRLQLNGAGGVVIPPQNPPPAAEDEDAPDE